MELYVYNNSEIHENLIPLKFELKLESDSLARDVDP